MDRVLQKDSSCLCNLGKLTEDLRTRGAFHANSRFVYAQRLLSNGGAMLKYLFRNRHNFFDIVFCATRLPCDEQYSNL